MRKKCFEFPTVWCFYSIAIKLTDRCPPLSKSVWCKPVLDRKFDRNADALQRTITDVGEQDPAPGATGRTATDSHGQSMPNPPFGMPSIFFEPHHTSSKATSGLRFFSPYLYTATAATALQPNYQRSKGDAEMQNRNRAKAPKGPILLVAEVRNKSQLLFFRFLVRMFMDNEKLIHTTRFSLWFTVEPIERYHLSNLMVWFYGDTPLYLLIH